MVPQVRVNEVSFVAEHFLPKSEPRMIRENGTENSDGFSCNYHTIPYLFVNPM